MNIFILMGNYHFTYLEQTLVIFKYVNSQLKYKGFWCFFYFMVNLNF